MDIRLPIDTLARRAALAAVCLAALIGSVVVIKWGLAHAAARAADSLEVAALAAELGPADPQTHVSYAVRSERTLDPADLEIAVAEYEKAAALSPHNYLIWLALGKARERSGDREGAERALRRAVLLAPNYTAPRWTLGNVLLRQGRTDEGFAEVRIAASGDPAYTDAAASMAWQLLGGDAAEVRRVLGDSPRLNLALAKLLAAQKEYDGAFAIWSSIRPEDLAEQYTHSSAELAAKFAEGGRFRNAFSALAAAGLIPDGGSFGQVRDPGFEQPVKLKDPGMFEWQVEGGVSPRIGLTEGQRRSGSYALFVGFPAGAKEFRHISQRVAVLPGAKYGLELFYRSDVRGDSHLKWEVVSIADGRTLAELDVTAASAEWRSVSAEFRVPEDSDGVMLRFVRRGCPDCTLSGNIWFDDVTIKEV